MVCATLVAARTNRPRRGRHRAKMPSGTPTSVAKHEATATSMTCRGPSAWMDDRMPGERAPRLRWVAVTPRVSPARARVNSSPIEAKVRPSISASALSAAMAPASSDPASRRIASTARGARRAASDR